MITTKKSDITQECVDVIVNAANSQLKGGGGVDGAIHRAAGPSVMKECHELGSCPTGSAVMTNAGNLKAKKIIHAVGPVWHGGNRHEAEQLESVYRTCFEIAKREGFFSIAFPAISTGVYGYPKEAAAKIALLVAQEFVADFNEIRFVCFSDEDLKIYQKLAA